MKKKFEERNELTNIKTYTPGDSIELIKRKYKLDQITKLASNENPLGSAVEFDQLKAAYTTTYLYPDSTNHSLTTKLSTLYEVDSNSIILGNGSDEIFQLLALAYLEPDSEVICPEYTFSVYESVTQLMGATYKKVPTKQFNTDLAAIIAEITSKTKLIFIANPNNPTGTFINHDELKRFLKQVPRSVIVVLDEAYKEYVTSEQINSNISLLKTYDNVIITRTFSKMYGLAGLRIGYGLASSNIVSSLQKVRPPFNVNSLALAAATKALDNKSFVERSQKVNQDGLKQYEKACLSWPVTLLKTQANFVCIILHNKIAQTAYDTCIKKGIIIRKLNSFGIDNGIRITIGTQKQNQECIECLNELFDKE